MVKFNDFKIILFWPLQYFLLRSATADMLFKKTNGTGYVLHGINSNFINLSRIVHFNKLAFMKPNPFVKSLPLK